MYPMLYKSLKIISIFVFFLSACSQPQKESLNLYSTRHYKIDQTLYEEFTKKTGIKINVLKSDPDAILTRLEQEKNNPQADLFFTADYPRLYRATQMDLLEPIQSPTLLTQTLAEYRDSNYFWYAISYRLRIIAIAKDFNNIKPTTYADLTNSTYKGQILVRSGANAYNISLIASFLAKWGEQSTREFLQGFVANFARNPEGNDRKQVADIYAKKGSLAIVNSYYIGLMYDSVDPEVQKAIRTIDLIYPQDTHLNISGFGFVKNSKNKENALKLLEFLTSEYAQNRLAQENFEYPVNSQVQASDVFLQWDDTPKIDNTPLSDWGQYYEEASKLMDEAGWK